MTGKTTEDLRASLFQTIDDLQADRISAQRAIALCKVSAEIIKTAEIELKAAQISAGPDELPDVSLLQLTSESGE